VIQANHQLTAVREAQNEQPRTRIVRNYHFRVAYDAQAFLSANGGTGKGIYLRNFIAPYADSFVGLATRGQSYYEHRLIQQGLSRYHPWHQISLPYLLHKLRADYFVAPYNTAPLIISRRTRLILVLHDLILLERLHSSSLRQRLDNEYRRFLIPKSVSRAHIVVTVSSYVKRQIEERFPSARVQAIPNTIAASWFVGKRARTIDERDNYILMVTSSAPHKNTKRALESYAAFVARVDRITAPRLRVVGLGSSPQVFRNLAAALQIGDLIDFQPYVTESQLQDLYRRSRAVLVPSLMEGFGIPVLEAMASGTPVIASNTTSLPEVGGPAAAYFNPTDVAAMTIALKQVLGDPHRQQKMIGLGLAQAQIFHPDIVGKTIKNFWDTLKCSERL
jgi:glycosyltransferase involved in cell wall biosynthesis